MLNFPEFSQRSVPATAVKKVEPILGGVAIAWAFLDQVVEFWIVATYGTALKRNLASKVPGPLEDRIDLLKKCFTRLPELSDLKDQALPLLAEVRRLASQRHMMIHGVLTHYVTKPEDAFIFVKLRYDRKISFHVAEEQNYTFRAMDQMAQDARNVTGAMQQIMKVMNGRFD